MVSIKNASCIRAERTIPSHTCLGGFDHEQREVAFGFAAKAWCGSCARYLSASGACEPEGVLTMKDIDTVGGAIGCEHKPEGSPRWGAQKVVAAVTLVRTERFSVFYT